MLNRFLTLRPYVRVLGCMLPRLLSASIGFFYWERTYWKELLCASGHDGMLDAMSWT